MSPGGSLPLPWGYIHAYDHNIQTSSRKPLSQSKPNFMWSIVRGMNVNNGPGRVTKMAAMAINNKKTL